MREITRWLKDHWLYLIPVLLLVVFITSIWDRNFYIGGDIVLPLNPQNNIFKSIFLWEGENRGMSFFRYALLIWQVPFYILSSSGVSPLICIKIFIIVILIIGFIATYFLYKLLFKDTVYSDQKLALLSGFIFIFSASQINILAGTIFLSALPLCTYFVVKYLDTKKLRYAIFFSTAVSFAYIAHLPQAKYLIILSAHLFFILLVLFNRYSFAKVNKLFDSFKATRIRESIKNLHQEIHVFREHKKMILHNLALSFLIQALSPISSYFIGLSLGLKISMLYYFIFVPIIGAITMLPISLGGLGLRDATTIFFFAKVGVSKDLAFAMSLLGFAILVVYGALGGLVYVLTVHHRRIQHH